MCIKIEREGGAKGREYLDEYRRGVFSHMPALGRLLDNLDAGTYPDSMTVMAAISEMVAFQTQPDPSDHGAAQICSLLPGGSCRSC